MGRHTKLTPAVQDAIEKSVSVGIDVESACQREGIGRRTLYEWVRRGETGEEPYLSFALAMERAQAVVTARITRNVIKASKEDWRAGAWWLERRRNSVYGPPKQHITHEAIAKEVESMSEAELLEIAKGIVERRSLPASVSVTDDEDDE